MKKVYLVITSVFLIGFLAACGANDNNDSVNAPNETNQEVDTENNNVVNNSEENEANGDAINDNDDDATNNNDIETTEKLSMNEKMDQLNFAEIEVEVDYGDDQEYEAEIEKKSNDDYEVEIEDELTNTYLKGEEAFNELYPIFKKLDITADSTKEEVIDAVLKSFDLEEDYKEIEVEVTFHDGTELEYEDEK